MCKRLSFIVLAVMVAAGVCWAAQGKIKLIINGEVASSDVKMINGKPYAPVADVARAMNMVVSKSGGNYAMAVAGGANQVDGSKQGKIGSELFTGKWKFQVLSVETANSYSERYYQEARTIKPQGRGEELIIVNCKVKNGTKKAKAPLLTERIPMNTGLADDKGQSYAPLDYDAKQESDKIMSYSAASLLPGAGMDFALVFSVPKGTQPKALVFTVAAYPDDVGKTGVDVRVDLTQ